MNPDLEQQLRPGQIWLVVTTYRHAGEHRIEGAYMILLAAAHPDWKDRPGLHRTHLRHGNLAKYTREQALDNMQYLRTTPMRRSDWSPILDRYDKKRLQYREMLGEI